MLLKNNMAVYGIVVCISILQTSCAPSVLKDVQTPIEATAVDAQPMTCDDPLSYYSGLAAQTNEKLSTAETTTLPVENATDECLKLNKAIRLSMPGIQQQNDKEALVLLEHLKHTGVLSGSDLQFNNMLLRHVSQRQDLRKMIAAQEKRLVRTETQITVLRNQLKTLQLQLDQLKNIEVEIDKKERSLTSPTSE